MIHKIPLRNRSGKIIDYTLIDDDVSHLKKFRWSKSPKGYARRNIRLENSKYKTIIMHRLIMNISDPKIQIDHINGNKLDNRKCNLRILGNMENCQNLHKLDARNTSGYRGVSWDKANKKWIAIAGYRNKKIYLGLFDSAKTAGEKVEKWRLSTMPFLSVVQAESEEE